MGDEYARLPELRDSLSRITLGLIRGMKAHIVKLVFPCYPLQYGFLRIDRIEKRYPRQMAQCMSVYPEILLNSLPMFRFVLVRQNMRWIVYA